MNMSMDLAEGLIVRNFDIKTIRMLSLATERQPDCGQGPVPPRCPNGLRRLSHCTSRPSLKGLQLVGFPVFNVAQACIDLGMQFVALRNEQSASYAASAYGYLTGKPGVLITVPGPGVSPSEALKGR
jgi:hypothetical protein